MYNFLCTSQRRHLTSIELCTDLLLRRMPDSHIHLAGHDRLRVAAILPAILSTILSAILRTCSRHRVWRWIWRLTQNVLEVLLHRLMLLHGAGNLLGRWHFLHSC